MKNINLAGLTVLGLFASVLPIHAAVVALPVSVPESGQTLLLLGLALAAVIALRYKLAK
ncbi:MAG: hypothetical protein ACJ8M1_02610 [Chthoniobacterales bacterium]